MQSLIGKRSMMRALAPLLVAVTAHVGRAQAPRRLDQADSIPLELVTALVSAGGLGGEPQILVGSLPGWVVNRLYIPSNARVVGSAFLGSTVVGILSVPDAPESVTADFKRELVKRAWKTPPPTPSYGGFRSAATTAADGSTPTRLTLCGDQQTLTTSATRRRGTSTEVVIRVAGGPGYFCNPQPMSAGMPRSPFPTLFNPANASDARMASDCSSAGNSSSGTGTILHTAMPADTLLSHYARQLQDSGWHSTSDKASIVGRSWTRMDSTGSPLELTLTVTTSARDSMCRELNLQVRSPRRP